MLFSFVLETYRGSLEESEQHYAEGAVEAAVAVLRSKHPDFEHFYPLMEFLSHFFFTNHAEMPLADYLEALYCVAKHGDFTRSWRAQLRAAARPVEAIHGDVRAN
jgi:hypothetical protein